jgi:hypothetical protein
LAVAKPGPTFRMPQSRQEQRGFHTTAKLLEVTLQRAREQKQYSLQKIVRLPARGEVLARELLADRRRAWLKVLKFNGSQCIKHVGPSRTSELCFLQKHALVKPCPNLTSHFPHSPSGRVHSTPRYAHADSFRKC